MALTTITTAEARFAPTRDSIGEVNIHLTDENGTKQTIETDTLYADDLRHNLRYHLSELADNAATIICDASDCHGMVFTRDAAENLADEIAQRIPAYDGATL